ncbi:MAG TPA: alpha/beta fold hydrolase [Syntrophobacteria bacterium]|nr:alpha/beta fold hydrolase [Syntrophobacteria bacterium]
MAERRIFISSGSMKLEALLDLVDGTAGVVVTHPHPLYGGDMENGVVESIVRVYRSNGYSTLRFNFRGAGMSQGRYDDGRGEQEDVRSALQFLSSHGKTKVDLAGYSFGAWVNALAMTTHSPVNDLLLISPPVAFLDFSAVGFLVPLKLVVAGSHDQFAPPERIRALLPTWNPEARFKVIAGADHFYWGYAEELETILADFLDGRRATNVPRL